MPDTLHQVAQLPPASPEPGFLPIRTPSASKRTRVRLSSPPRGYREALRPRGRHLEGKLRLVVAGIAARVRGILVDADVHPVRAGIERAEHVGAGARRLVE